MNYKLDVARDVDKDGYWDLAYVLNLPKGFRFYDDLDHSRGYSTMAELRLSAKNEVESCDCKACKK
jgi:hypothetical protein